jgi:hypothetical protein
LVKRDKFDFPPPPYHVIIESHANELKSSRACDG